MAKWQAQDEDYLREKRSVSTPYKEISDGFPSKTPRTAIAMRIRMNRLRETFGDSLPSTRRDGHATQALSQAEGQLDRGSQLRDCRTMATQRRKQEKSSDANKLVEQLPELSAGESVGLNESEDTGETEDLVNPKDVDEPGHHDRCGKVNTSKLVDEPQELRKNPTNVEAEAPHFGVTVDDIDAAGTLAGLCTGAPRTSVGERGRYHAQMAPTANRERSPVYDPWFMNKRPQVLTGYPDCPHCSPRMSKPTEERRDTFMTPEGALNPSTHPLGRSDLAPMLRLQRDARNHLLCEKGSCKARSQIPHHSHHSHKDNPNGYDIEDSRMIRCQKHCVHLPCQKGSTAEMSEAGCDCFTDLTIGRHPEHPLLALPEQWDEDVVLPPIFCAARQYRPLVLEPYIQNRLLSPRPESQEQDGFHGIVESERQSFQNDAKRRRID